MKEEWFNEYKPIFEKIKTPSEVYQSSRLSSIATTGCSDDYDEIEINAKMEGFRRESTYVRIINELYCMFLQKVTTEVDRYTLLFMEECGYKGTDFSFENFCKFTKERIGGDMPIELFKKCSGYNCHHLLHKINNFLKHNSRESYKALFYCFPENVRSVKNGTATEEYKNGQFAGDWIIIKPNYLDKVFDKLVGFFEDYCELVLHEDKDESKWNYDEYFENAYYEMRDPYGYYGL